MQSSNEQSSMSLRELWESRGMGPGDLAARSGVSVPTLYRMNEKKTVLGKNIAKVCEALGISRSTYDSLRPE